MLVTSISIWVDPRGPDHRTPPHSGAATSGNCADTPPRSQPFHNPIDALVERADVIGLDGREHRHPEWVAAEFAVRLGGRDAIDTQDLRDGARVHVVGEVDGADHLRTQLRSSHLRIDFPLEDRLSTICW